MFDTLFKKIMWGLGTVAFLVLGVFVYLIVANVIFQQEASSDTNQTKGAQEEAKAGEVSANTIEQTQATVGKENKDVGEFVSTTHDFYNDTTGFGGIGNLSWNDQRAKAEMVLKKVEELLPNVTSETLKSDLQEIEGLANSVLEREDKGTVRNLHRMFHDLDIALNSYNGYDKVWDVTETLRGE
ncbi:hypothetical protein MUO14_19765 [Halobacillus shinanisalinarum]|uniref:Uncharacterized protein n=1 Tax=Halobacillus shinanisalinarum TaxID=2932258 RepID=A0ABY4GXH8_9BACI|nr:hypothetical protein [Halobacillus shinanisalinarum]UOQ92640.1 hypothetical protein MUO14_19765 [Halobacillus shinanisalinarum]